MSKKVYLKSYKYSEAYQAALEFDGTDDYVNIPHSSKLDVTGNITIEAWVYLHNYSDFNMIVTKTTGNGGTNNTYQFRIEQTTGLLRFLHRSGGSTKAFELADPVPLNTWTHVVVKKSTADGVLFINGNRKLFLGGGGTSTSNTNDVKIGSRDDLGNFFDGLIGEVRIWDFIRTDQAILADRTKELTGEEAGLVGYWKLNEGAGTTAEDSSSSPQDGTLTSFPANAWVTNNPAPIYTTAYAGFFNNFGVSSYSKSIYSGNGELTLTVPRKFDDFDEGNTIGHGNRVDVYVFDKNDNSGTKIYTGTIEEYTSAVSSNEDVSVRCLGIVNRLALDTYTDSKALTKSYSSQDPALVVRDIIDQYQFSNGENITYTTSTIPTTSDTVSLELSSTTYLEALNLVTRTAGADYYWLLNNDNQIVFKKFSTTPTHYFMFGRDIAYLEAQNSIVDLRNSLLAWNRLPSSDSDYISKRYERMLSLFKYGRRQTRKADGRYKASADGFDKFAENYFEIYSEPIASLRFEVIDNSYGRGYNIESIQPGDTCRILNIKKNSSISDNMLITHVEYSFDRVVIDIVDVQQFISRSLFDIREQLAEQAYTNAGPDTFTQDEI